MPSRVAVPLLALPILVFFVSTAQPPSDTATGPQEKRARTVPEEVRLHREELVRLRRELVGRRILREARRQLPHVKIENVVRRYNIRLDERLKELTDRQLRRLIDDTSQMVRSYPVYDQPNAEMKDICEEVAGVEAEEAPVLSCVDDDAIIEASQSVAAIVHENFIEPLWDEETDTVKGWTLTTRSLELADTASADLCEIEPIRSSPSTVVAGTAFLVSENIVATAGHVISSEDFLDHHYFVFGYVMKSDGQPKTVFDENDVYRGQEEVARQTGTADFALIRLDRDATGRTKLYYRKNGKIPDDAKLFMLGHPEGMPMKYVGEVGISWNGFCSYFLSPLDARPGNSGSPVFNAASLIDGEDLCVEGMLVRDVPTYIRICDCYITDVHSEAYGYSGADVVRTTQFAGLLEHPDFVLVRSKLPQDETAFIVVDSDPETTYTFDGESQSSRSEQFLPCVLDTQDPDAVTRLSLLSDVGEATCWKTYDVKRGSVWDIVLHDTSGSPVLKEACDR